MSGPGERGLRRGRIWVEGQHSQLRGEVEESVTRREKRVRHNA